MICLKKAEKRIQEDYLRILRYLRFYLNYSNHKHQSEIIKNIKKNIDGISNISSERLIDELKKITSSNGFLKLFKDKESLELIEIIFPQLKNIKNKKFKKLALGNIPMGKAATESDVATTVCFLASSASSMITGTSIIIDGGWTAQ